MSEVSEKISARLSFNDAGCWEWQGAKVRKGYGVVQSPLEDRLIYTHRAMYEEHRGSIPEGMQIDHLCRNPACCNPAHLEVVTPAENTRRGRSVEVSRSRKGQSVACPRGHAYTESNSYYDARGYRSCRECRALKHIVQRENRRRYRDLTAQGANVVGIEAAQNG